MITFEIDDENVPENDRFSADRLAKIAHAIANGVPGRPTGVLTLSFVDDKEIRRLNRMYRGKDKVTDVLSFPSGDAELSGYIGDVIISYDQAVRQAEGDVELELTDLLVHGILHVLGYDHEKPEDAALMFPLQDKIVAEVL